LVVDLERVVDQERVVDLERAASELEGPATSAQP
jgi:hypothetical protein